MPTNLELKVKLHSFASVEGGLKKIKAKHTALLKQKDIYYRSTTGLMKLRVVNGKQEFIYYERNENTKKRWSNYEVLAVERANAERFFARLFPVELIVTKSRELYMYKNTRIHLDTVRGLGKYLELETVVSGKKSDAAKEFAFVKSALGLDDFNEIRLSYRDLILQKGSMR